MKDLIKEYLDSYTKKRIKTRDIEGYLRQNLGLTDYSYRNFVQQIEELVVQGRLSPIKARGQNGRLPQLYNWYRIESTDPEISSELRQELLTCYHPDLNISYYLDNPDDYQSDKGRLQRLNEFLQNQEEAVRLTLNERSFQLFGDEKFLASKQGHQLLRRVGLNFSDLKCYPTIEPFFYYRRRSDSVEENILIIENKDTFFSLKKLLQEDIYCWNQTSVSLLIYGEGKKIQQSFSFFWELVEYQDQELNFYYFGDLDAEGILIWQGLQSRYQVEFRPFKFFYRQLIQRYGEQASSLVKKQHFNQQALKDFTGYFTHDWTERIERLITNNRYIPQEGLNYYLLKKISD